MVKVLYVMGLYRSGSTILDIVLANHAKMVGVGELRNLPYTFAGRSERCACGVSVIECPFWLSVRGVWEARVGGQSAGARLASLQDRFERTRSLPRVLLQGAWRTRDFDDYCSLTTELYRAIAEVSEREIIVDSSKYPARSFALLTAPDIDLRIVHLVRDGRAVIWSVRRKESTEVDLKSEQVTAHTTRQWTVTNLLSSVVAARAGSRAIRMRYEDLVTAPARELARIGALAGEDVASLTERVLSDEPLDVAHTVAGNRVRMRGQVKLRLDDEWRSRLSPRDGEVFWQRAGWLARQYGYAER